jgi:DNA replication protein DnaT
MPLRPTRCVDHAEGGTVAVFADNAPAFYAITPERLAQLLEIEAQLSRPASDVTLDTSSLMNRLTFPVTVPMGKFALYAGWQPDADFQRQAALWGIALTQPATAEELAAFTAWWQAEGKVFTHIQWQQKLARIRLPAPATAASQNAISTRFQNRINRSPADSEVRNEERRRPDETSAKNDACQREARVSPPVKSCWRGKRAR